MNLAAKIWSNLTDSVTLGYTFPLRHLARLLGQKLYRTTIRYAGTIYIRPNSTDAGTFLQVFRDRQYDLSGQNHGQLARVMAAYQSILDAEQTPIIIDAGANVGAASIWFAKLFPRARIIAIEPDSANAEVCRLNTRSLPNVRIIEAAIGCECGRVSLTNPEQRAWSIQTMRNENGEVPVCTIPDLARDAGVAAKLFIVKIDIEGFEADLFAKNTQWVDDTEVIIIEPHDWLFPGRATSVTFQKVLAAGNHEIVIHGENLFYIRHLAGKPHNIS